MGPGVRMRPLVCLLVVGSLAAGGVEIASLAAEPTAGPDFNREIRPLLSRNCFACHGPDEHDRQADLRLDEREAAVDYGAIVPGKPAESEMIARIHQTDPDLIMPPPESHHTLSDAEKELLEQWIAGGAEYAPHWAYVAPRAHPTPEPQSDRWAESWIDAFVLDSLKKQGLAPASDADPLTLLRRAYFDLTGMPPSPEEVDRYLGDPSPDRYEQLVERLLASPRHAERMASWWLDLVRYADTVGYHGDQTHNASPYRDWVIHAFAENMPFDRFTVLQLAGDLVGPADGEHPDDRLLAAAYNRLLQTSHEGGLQVKEYRAIYQADRIRSVSAVWMGATVGCAQCHDHKYDPYTARDFYSLGAFFADIDDEKHLGRGGFGGGTNTLPTTRFPEKRVVSPFDRGEAARLDRQIERLEESLPPPPQPKVAAVPTSSKPSGDTAGRKAPDKDAKAPPPEPPEVTARRAKLASLVKRRKAIERPVMVTQSLDTPRTTRILPRGNWMDDSGELVEPAVPAFLGELGEIAVEGRATRADLARWLVTPVEQGGVGEFTARVTANRLWAVFFGHGLCRSVEDFGGQGEPPDHPELLDRLAIELVASGWDVRGLIRQIVTSHAYRQSSFAAADVEARDPENRLLARQGRWRLPAEHVRDTLLFTSGLLVEQLGGPSVRPYQPAGYYRHLNFPKRKYTADTDARQWRRGLYVHWQRMFLHPQLAAFDAPSREECTARRLPSNTPKAALVLLNDPSFVEAARSLAGLAIREGGSSDRGRISYLWRRTLSREPDQTELELVEGLLARRREEYTADTPAASQLLAVGVAPLDASLPPAELAAWTAVTRAVLNLHEAIARY